MSRKTIVLSEAVSTMTVRFHLLEAQTPESSAFIWDLLAVPRQMPAIHAMWTGPEISCPIPTGMIDPTRNARPLTPENVTVTPQAGELVLAYVPARMWGGNSEPVFDLGVFYGPGGRMLFPIGWIPGNVIARVDPDDLEALAHGCNVIRRNGACTLSLSRGE